MLNYAKGILEAIRQYNKDPGLRIALILGLSVMGGLYYAFKGKDARNDANCDDKDRTIALIRGLLTKQVVKTDSVQVENSGLKTQILSLSVSLIKTRADADSAKAVFYQTQWKRSDSLYTNSLKPAINKKR